MIQLYNVEKSILAQRITAFLSYDANHDGYISGMELHNKFRFLKNESKRHFTPGIMLPVKDILTKFDLNRDCKLNFLDFNQYVSKTATHIP